MKDKVTILNELCLRVTNSDISEFKDILKNFDINDFETTENNYLSSSVGIFKNKNKNIIVESKKGLLFQLKLILENKDGTNSSILDKVTDTILSIQKADPKLVRFRCGAPENQVLPNFELFAHKLSGYDYHIASFVNHIQNKKTEINNNLNTLQDDNSQNNTRDTHINDKIINILKNYQIEKVPNVKKVITDLRTIWHECEDTITYLVKYNTNTSFTDAKIKDIISVLTSLVDFENELNEFNKSIKMWYFSDLKMLHNSHMKNILGLLKTLLLDFDCDALQKIKVIENLLSYMDKSILTNNKVSDFKKLINRNKDNDMFLCHYVALWTFEILYLLKSNYSLSISNFGKIKNFYQTYYDKICKIQTNINDTGYVPKYNHRNLIDLDLIWKSFLKNIHVFCLITKNKQKLKSLECDFSYNKLKNYDIDFFYELNQKLIKFESTVLKMEDIEKNIEDTIKHSDIITEINNGCDTNNDEFDINNISDSTDQNNMFDKVQLLENFKDKRIKNTVENIESSYFDKIEQLKEKSKFFDQKNNLIKNSNNDIQQRIEQIKNNELKQVIDKIKILENESFKLQEQYQNIKKEEVELRHKIKYLNEDIGSKIKSDPTQNVKQNINFENTSTQNVKQNSNLHNFEDLKQNSNYHNFEDVKQRNCFNNRENGSSQIGEPMMYLYSEMKQMVDTLKYSQQNKHVKIIDNNDNRSQVTVKSGASSKYNDNKSQSSVKSRASSKYNDNKSQSSVKSGSSSKHNDDPSNEFMRLTAHTILTMLIVAPILYEGYKYNYSFGI
jgi:hypothetical protein